MRGGELRTAPGGTHPLDGMAALVERRRARWWRRTRIGLLLTAIGLLASWIPLVAVAGALFLSFGSTFLFLGARAAGRKHELAVVVAFVMLTIGGVIVGILISAFLFQAYDAGRRGLALLTLREVGGLLLWVTLPATFLIAAGFAVQVTFLLPRRQWAILYGLSALLAATAVVATWLAEPELLLLNVAPVRAGAVVDFLIRLSLYRVVEAPAYVGLAVLYFMANWEAAMRPRQRAVTAVAYVPR